MIDTTTIELRDADKDELIFIFESMNVPRVGEWVRFVSYGGKTYYGRVHYVGWCWDVNEPDDENSDEGSDIILSVIVTLTAVKYSVTKGTIRNRRLDYLMRQPLTLENKTDIE